MIVRQRTRTLDLEALLRSVGGLRSIPIRRSLANAQFPLDRAAQGFADDANWIAAGCVVVVEIGGSAIRCNAVVDFVEEAFGKIYGG
jgi:hypothetical protein